MRRRVLLQLLGVIVSGLNVAGPLVIDAQGLYPCWSWQYHALIGFVIFVVFIAWIICDKQQKINDLEQRRPSIIFACETIYGWLRVKNNGDVADFNAKAQRIDGGLPTGSWFIKWKDSDQKEQRIYRGDDHILEVASCVFSLPIATDNGSLIRKPFIRLHRVREQIVNERKQRVDSLEHDLSFTDKVIKIEVRIFSKPELLSPFQKRYLITLIEYEDTVSIEEILEANDEV